MTNAQRFLSLYPNGIASAQQHARQVFPEESCGFLIGDSYVPLFNHAANPTTHTDDESCECKLCAFTVSDVDYLKHQGKITAIIHSHPYGPAYPSEADMAHQVATDLAWVILTLDETRMGPITVWGGQCPIEPLIGREFIHGVNDCYSLVRDVFALGKNMLAEQGMEWPFKSINLPVIPRNDNWWSSKAGQNLYEDNIQVQGFVEISMSEVRTGDCFLGKIRSNKLNHAGVLLGSNLILHHLPHRLSRREPAGIWSRSADKWVRYIGAEYA